MHLLDRDRSGLDVLDRREPLHHHAFFQRLLQLEVTRGHLLAGTAIDNDRFFRAKPLCSARYVERGVATAVDNDATAKQRPVFAFHRPQNLYRIHYFGGFAGGNVGALGDVGTDGEKRRVEPASHHGLADIGDFRIVLDDNSEIGDALDLGVEHIAWQAIFRNAEAHHAA